MGLGFQIHTIVLYEQDGKSSQYGKSTLPSNNLEAPHLLAANNVFGERFI